MDLQGGVYLDHLKQMVQRGDVSEQQIDDAVRRILTIKFMLGLFDDPYRYCDSVRETNSMLTPYNLPDCPRDRLRIHGAPEKFVPAAPAQTRPQDRRHRPVGPGSR